MSPAFSATRERVMAFDVRVSGEHAKIVLSGDVDLQTTADLKTEIQNITDATRLEIEAGDVTYIDSSGVAVLLLARQHCAQNNIALSLPTISEAVHRVLQIAKLDVMLPIGQVVNSSDAGLMGLESSNSGAPAADDDLVSELLSGNDMSSGGGGVVGGVGDDANDADDDDDDAALAASLMDDNAATDTADSPASTGDFGGLDIGSADFNTPAAADDAADAEADDPVIEDGAMKPGSFS